MTKILVAFIVKNLVTNGENKTNLFYLNKIRFKHILNISTTTSCILFKKKKYVKYFTKIIKHISTAKKHNKWHEEKETIVSISNMIFTNIDSKLVLNLELWSFSLALQHSAKKKEVMWLSNLSKRAYIQWIINR